VTLAREAAEMPSEHYDSRETRASGEREADLSARLPKQVACAMTAPGWARQLAGLDPSEVIDRKALARLPLLRKSELPALQKQTPPSSRV
jgi:phenylacetate-CoA ligase